MKLSIPMLLVFLLASSCSNNNPVKSITQVEYGDGEDYDIYETVLHQRFDSSSVLLVVYDSTGTSFHGWSSDSMRVANLKGHMPGLLEETVANFVSTNENRTKLKYVRGIPHFILSSDYDGTAGNNKVGIGLSRVGYDRYRTQAVMEVGETWAPLAGSGTLYFLEKENGEWKIKAAFMTWIS